MKPLPFVFVSAQINCTFMRNLVFLGSAMTNAQITQSGASSDRCRRVGLRLAMQRRIVSRVCQFENDAGASSRRLRRCVGHHTSEETLDEQVACNVDRRRVCGGFDRRGRADCHTGSRTGPCAIGRREGEGKARKGAEYAQGQGFFRTSTRRRCSRGRRPSTTRRRRRGCQIPAPTKPRPRRMSPRRRRKARSARKCRTSKA
jgi:hypothetical protein